MDAVTPKQAEETTHRLWTGTAAGGAILILCVAHQAIAEGCPLIFDLNRNGKIETTAISHSQEKVFTIHSIRNLVSFDIDADGEAERIEWLTGEGDGFLVDFSLLEPGEQPNGKHLFGNALGHANGFEKLAEYDTDFDGVLAGQELGSLSFWVDDGDAVLEPGETLDLSDFEVKSIQVRSTDVNDKFGLPVQVGSADSLSGKMRVEDVWFLDASDIPEPLQPLTSIWRALFV